MSEAPCPQGGASRKGNFIPIVALVIPPARRTCRSRVRARILIQLLRNPYPICQFLDTAVWLDLAEENAFSALVIRRRKGSGWTDPLPIPYSFHGFNKGLGC
jgi:hypothetical protein